MYGIVKFYLKTNNYTKQEMKITYRSVVMDIA